MPLIGMTILGLVGDFISSQFGIPFSFVGIMSGTTILPPIALANFLGGLIGHYLIRRVLGSKNWETYRSVMVAGIAASTGIVTGITEAITLLSKSAWILPFYSG